MILKTWLQIKDTHDPPSFWPDLLFSICCCFSCTICWGISYILYWVISCWGISCILCATVSPLLYMLLYLLYSICYCISFIIYVAVSPLLYMLLYLLYYICCCISCILIRCYFSCICWGIYCILYSTVSPVF